MGVECVYSRGIGLSTYYSATKRNENYMALMAGNVIDMTSGNNPVLSSTDDKPVKLL